jgi:hypothetical protein
LDRYRRPLVFERSEQAGVFGLARASARRCAVPGRLPRKALCAKMRRPTLLARNPAGQTETPRPFLLTAHEMTRMALAIRLSGEYHRKVFQNGWISQPSSVDR